MDQSGEEINQAPQQKTGQERASDKEGVNEIQPPASAPVAANEEVSEEERQELESWMDEKLREGREQEAEAGKQGE